MEALAPLGSTPLYHRKQPRGQQRSLKPHDQRGLFTARTLLTGRKGEVLLRVQRICAEKEMKIGCCFCETNEDLGGRRWMSDLQDQTVASTVKV